MLFQEIKSLCYTLVSKELSDLEINLKDYPEVHKIVKAEMQLSSLDELNVNLEALTKNLSELINNLDKLRSRWTDRTTFSRIDKIYNDSLESFQHCSFLNKQEIIITRFKNEMISQNQNKITSKESLLNEFDNLLRYYQNDVQTPQEQNKKNEVDMYKKLVMQLSSYSPRGRRGSLLFLNEDNNVGNVGNVDNVDIVDISKDKIAHLKTICAGLEKEVGITKLRSEDIVIVQKNEENIKENANKAAELAEQIYDLTIQKSIKQNTLAISNFYSKLITEGVFTPDEFLQNAGIALNAYPPYDREYVFHKIVLALIRKKVDRLQIVQFINDLSSKMVQDWYDLKLSNPAIRNDKNVVKTGEIYFSTHDAIYFVRDSKGIVQTGFLSNSDIDRNKLTPDHVSDRDHTLHKVLKNRILKLTSQRGHTIQDGKLDLGKLKASLEDPKVSGSLGVNLEIVNNCVISITQDPLIKKADAYIKLIDKYIRSLSSSIFHKHIHERAIQYLKILRTHLLSINSSSSDKEIIDLNSYINDLSTNVSSTAKYLRSNKEIANLIKDINKDFMRNPIFSEESTSDDALIDPVGYIISEIETDSSVNENENKKNSLIESGDNNKIQVIPSNCRNEKFTPLEESIKKIQKKLNSLQGDGSKQNKKKALGELKNVIEKVLSNKISITDARNMIETQSKNESIDDFFFGRFSRFFKGETETRALFDDVIDKMHFLSSRLENR